MKKELLNNTILIVDDTPENLDVLNGLLYDFKRKVATDGERALKIVFSGNPPDLILLDIMMPGMDGYEVCRQIKANEKTKDIPVIFLTAKTAKEDIVKGFEVGGQDYVTKPFDHLELLKRVETQLELSTQRKELKELNVILDRKVKERTIELEETNKKLEEALEKLQGLDSAKTNFLKLVSHELRTPLNGIMGSAYFLKEVVEEPEMVEFIDMLKVSAERLEHLSNIALEITDMQAEVKQSANEIIVVKEVVEELIEELKKSNKLTHEVDTSKLNNIEVKGDRERISKAIKELLINAGKFVLGSNAIIVSSGVNDSTEWVCVENDSEYISDKKLEEISTPFGLAKSHSDGSTGLGLAYVNTVMAYHGGKMEITHDDGKTKVCLIFKG